MHERSPSAMRDTRRDEERILIHMTDSPATSALIRRGRRVADYLKADCFAVAVAPPADGHAPRPARDELEEQLSFARRLHIDTRRLHAADVAEALVDFARRNGVMQILVAKPRKRSPWLFYKHETAMRVVELARDMQVTVVAERRPADAPSSTPGLSTYPAASCEMHDWPRAHCTLHGGWREPIPGPYAHAGSRPRRRSAHP